MLELSDGEGCATEVETLSHWIAQVGGISVEGL
jgi:hypothetical protein